MANEEEIAAGRGAAGGRWDDVDATPPSKIASELGHRNHSGADHEDLDPREVILTPLDQSSP
jgi:hypothetical protein